MIEIESPSLSPSNMIAEEINGGRKTFPNLARRITDYNKAVIIPDVVEVLAEVDRQVLSELTEAGMPKFNGSGNVGSFDMSFGEPSSTSGRLAPNGFYKEVPTAFLGFFLGWKFERAWYYYRADGPGIPPEFAIPFDKEWGKEVRVDGDCACRGAEFWGQGFGIGSYHIDTQQGLNAFTAMLRKIYKERPKEEE